MRNTIAQAVDAQERAGVERLHDTGRLNYRATTVQAPVGNNGVGEALLNFGMNAARMYGSYKEASASLSEERSDEIIRKLSPEQRRQAVASGTLLYQDDPDAMEALRFKSGRNAAFEVDTEIREKIGQGAFKSQQELTDYRQTRLEGKSKAYAESVGIDPADQAYQRGFNADIVQRNNAVFDMHARKLSEQAQAIAQMEAVSDLGSMFAGESFLRSETAPADFAAYFSGSLESGSIPTEGMAMSILQETLAQNASQPGADVFFKNLSEQTVNLYGREVKIRDLVGPEVLENYQVKSGEAAFNRNRQLTQEFTFGLQDAEAQTDPQMGLTMLSKMQGALYHIQDTDVVTRQTQQLDAARGRLLGRISQDSVARAKEMDKKIKADNRALLFETKYAQRIAGDTVSTDWRTFETDDNTGTFKEEDAANFAIKKLAELDRMSLTDAERDRQKLNYLRADYSSGPFQKHFQTLTADAVAQFKGLVASDAVEITEENTGRIREFQRIYQADPATISELYPEQAAMAERVSRMEGMGIGIETMVDADRKQKGLTKEERALQERKWGELFTSSDSVTAYIPANLRNAARTLYDSELFRTGDETGALEVIRQWLDKTTVGFESAQRSAGRVQKRTLMVDPLDTTSWRVGRDILDGFVKDLYANAPWLNEGDLTITETPQGIVISDPLSSIRPVPISTDHLREYHKAKQADAQRAAEEDARQRAEEKIGQYKAEQQRRSQSPFAGLDPSTGTLEGAAGFRDR